jgi:hypothetical protein
MALSVNKVAPSAVVLAFVGYCIWPSVVDLASGQPKPKEVKNDREVAASLLSPAMPSPPTRNPWGGLDADALAAAKEAAKSAEKVADASSDSAADRNADRSIDPLGSLKLDATCILGSQRMAMINGRMYANQESLILEGASTSSYQIIEVLPYKVVLEHKGQTIELTYSTDASKSASPTRVRTHGKPQPQAASHVKTAPTTSTVASNARK